MPSWLTILESEAIAKDWIENGSDVDEDATCTLLEKFRPNAGGQTDFFSLLPLNTKDEPKHSWIALCGGIGSGKTYCGAAWVASRALMHPECRGLIAANTFGQLARSTLTGLVELCRDFNVPLEPYAERVEDNALAIANRQRCYIGPNRTFVYVLSLNSFMGLSQAGRGLQVRWAWVDEIAFAPEQAFQTLAGRLGRGPGTMRGTGIVTSSPNGFNWFYDRFGDPTRDERKKKVFHLITCSTRENARNLGEDYVASLEANYTEELAQQELEGQFVNTTTGRVFKYFNRAFHSLESQQDIEILEYDRHLPLHVAFDFNRSPACALLSQLRGNEIHCFWEFYLKNSDTFELSETVSQWILDSEHRADIYIYGDATGRVRTANSRQSNWEIVWQTLKERNIQAHKRYKDSNPPVVSRVNSANYLFRENRVFVHRHHCSQLIKDFENLTWEGDDINKKDGDRSHLADAFSYMLHWLYPYKAKAKHRMGQEKIQGLPA